MNLVNQALALAVIELNASVEVYRAQAARETEAKHEALREARDSDTCLDQLRQLVEKVADTHKVGPYSSTLEALTLISERMGNAEKQG